MQHKFFRFTKIEKDPKTIEAKINQFFESNKAFKFACQSENVVKNSFYISIYYENKKSNIRAKVFKNADELALEESINQFLKEGHTVKWSTQTSSSNTIYIILFYELRNGDEEKQANENG
jgi:hypothetical protein